MEFWLSAPVEAEPEVGWVPLHAPEALQVVALVEFQVSVLADPAVTDVGEADRDSVGAGVTTVGPKKLVTSKDRLRLQPLPLLPLCLA